MGILALILTITIVLKCGLCEERHIEISNVVLKKGKPLELEKTHIEEIEIKGLKGTLYSDSLSKLSEVSSIKLTSSQLKEIEPGAICPSPSLKKFEIDLRANEEPPTLKGEHFDHCENLEELSLTGDYDKLPKIIENDCLHNLKNLKSLSMNHISVGHVTKEYFKGLKSLSTLSINRCRIEDIDQDAFEDLEDLEKLDIRFSSIKRLPKHLFKKTRKLHTLYLTHCNITEITWDEFEGLTSLRELHLYSNYINHFDADKVAKYMPNLEKLSIELNPVECKKKELFVKELKDKLHHEIQVSYKFDPGYYDSCEEEH